MFLGYDYVNNLGKLVISLLVWNYRIFQIIVIYVNVSFFKEFKFWEIEFYVSQNEK